MGGRYNISNNSKIIFNILNIILYAKYYKIINLLKHILFYNFISTGIKIEYSKNNYWINYLNLYCLIYIIEIYLNNIYWVGSLLFILYYLYKYFIIIYLFSIIYF